MSAAWMKKHWIKTILLTLLGLITASIGSCAFLTRDREASWEEEVLLNTGETIWITKQIRYRIRGQAGNPLDLSLRASDIETITFTYQGREYLYKGTVGVRFLAISPSKLPVLIGHPGGGEWAKYNAFPVCTKPYYVQFVPDTSDRGWTWLKNIEPWTYDLPVNVLSSKIDYSDLKKRYSMAEKNLVFDDLRRDPRLANTTKINPLASNQDCREQTP